MTIRNLCIDPSLINYIDKSNTKFAGVWTKVNDLIDRNNISSIQTSPELTSNDRELAESCYVNSLNFLMNVLNRKHKSNFSLHSWECLIGPWVRISVFSFLVKWKFLKAVENEKYILLHSFQDHQNLISADFNEFHSKFYDYTYSNDLLLVMSKLLNIEDKKINISRHTKSFKPNKNIPFVSNVKSKKLLILKFFYSSLEILFSLFSRRKNIFLYKTMSPKSLPLLCLLKTGAFPDSSFKEFCFHRSENYWKDFRLSEITKLNEIDKKSFSKCINALLLLTIPQTYLEEFESIQRLSKKEFPKSQKYTACISSTAQWSNDVFKAWLMDSKEKGLDFYVWQHGGTYGTTKILTHQEYLERKISKSFFTWGWIKDRSKDKPFSRPMFINKLRLKRPIKEKRRILIVLTRIKNASKGDAWDTDRWNDDYMNLINQLCINLSKIKNANLVLRLHPTQTSKNFEYKKYLQKKFLDVQFDAYKNLEDSIANSAIVISTQNSTVFLQSLLSRKVSLGIWNEDLIPFSDNAKPYFEKLKNEKIYFKNPKKLSDTVSKIMSSKSTFLKFKKFEPEKSVIDSLIKFDSSDIGACLKDI